MPTAKSQKGKRGNKNAGASAASPPANGKWSEPYKPPIGFDGRRWVTSNDGHMRPVDELVCNAFNGPPPAPDAWVEHIDGDLANDEAVNLRWTTAPRPQVSSGYVYEEGLTLADVLGMAAARVEHEPDSDEPQTPLMVVEVEREDTADESINKFMYAVHSCETPGCVIGGAKTPLKHAVVKMVNVGVVVRKGNGERMYHESGNPTLYAPSNTKHLFAAFAPDVVARLRLGRMPGLS